MLVYFQADLFASPAQTLVNPVDTAGSMGEGISRGFEERYPEMFRGYRRRCESGELQIGKLLLWRGADRWVLSFPTRTSRRLPSTLEAIRAGLEKFVAIQEELGITSISFPPLGDDEGGLPWDEVKPLLESHLRNLPLEVYVHDRHLAPDFMAEPAKEPPAVDFWHFLADLRALSGAPDRSFETLDGGSHFTASLLENGDLEIHDSERAERQEKIPHEELETAWSSLQAGLLTADQLGGGANRRYDRYLFGLLARLSYVEAAPVQQLRRDSDPPGYGLFFPQRPPALQVDARREQVQGKLWA